MVLQTLSKKYGRLLLGAVLIPTALALSYFRVFELYELQTYDWRCQLRGPRPVSSDIVLIDIWDDTLEALGAWPIDRRYHADLIKVLKVHGARVVGFDTLFVEPRDGDDAVAAAAQNARNVYFVYAFLSPQRVGERFVSEKFLAPLIEAYGNSARGTGHVNARSDIDGKRRRTFPVIHCDGKAYYQMSFQIALDLLGVSAKDVVLGPRSLKIADKLDIPLDDEGCFIINYAGVWEKTFQHFSYYDILAAYLEKASGAKPRIDLGMLKGKICFVGLTSLGSHDTNPIPIQSIYPMVGQYANVLNSILQKDFIRRLDRVFNTLLLSVFAFLIAWVSLRLGPFRALVSAIALTVVYAAAVIFVFVIGGFWADLFYPLVLFTLVYTGSTLGRALFEIKKRELIENELKIASQIQKSFLPGQLPALPGLSVVVYMKPAKAVGGDLYSFVSLGPERLGVMIGDVSGKGTPAALFMAKIVSEFKFSARDRTDPAAVLVDLNDSTASENTGGLFVTLSYGIFDLRNRKLVLSNGGHLPAIWLPAGKQPELVINDEGMPIGVLAGVVFSNSSMEIKPGDCFAFYSDGVSEARNRKKQEFGVEALQDILSENRHCSAEETLGKIVARLDRFIGKAEQHDDITMIVVKVGT